MIDEIALGEYAEQLRENPALKAAFQVIKADLFDEFSRNTMWSGVKKREHIHKQICAINALEDKIDKFISDSNAAKKFLQKRDRLRSVR